MKIHPYEIVKKELLAKQKIWLVTGVAGFIGSNLLEELLKLNQVVVGVDNLSSGSIANIHQVQQLVTEAQWSRFNFINADIRDYDTCNHICNGVDYVLHQAAIGSVPRSIENPLFSHENNVDGFLNMIIAAKDSKVKNFIYASSSSVYGSIEESPKVEGLIGDPLSPYALTKRINEMYSKVFFKTYQFNSIGLRYFNVFGKRQNPDGPYSAVIPRWIAALIRGDEVTINGDGSTSRDFCYVDNVVQVNILAATSKDPIALNNIYNVAVGESTSLNNLFQSILTELKNYMEIKSVNVRHQSFRSGDIYHSLADITQAKNLLGYKPAFNLHEGLCQSIPWYLSQYSKNP